MADMAEAFVAALAADLITADDFACGGAQL